MKRHYGHFGDLFLEDCNFGEPQIDGNGISLPVLRDLMILDRHPLAAGTGTFYCDGFTLVFEGVTRSVRELALYRDETGEGFERNIRMEDGPFAACKRPMTTFEVGGVLPSPFSYIVSWEIDAAEFYLLEPGGPWEKYRESSAGRADLEQLKRDIERDRQG